MNHNIPYAATARTSGIAEILDMIARHGPRLMKEGGGPLHRDGPSYQTILLSLEEKARIVSLVGQGKTQSEIAALTGRSLASIHRITKGLKKNTKT